MDKILAVVRESTEQQEIESQKKELEDFCYGLGYKSIEWISVAGASARKVNQEYLDMLDSIKDTITTNGIKSVAFWHLNRLGRKESYIMQMKEWFVRNHIQVHVKNPALTLLREDGTLDAGANIAWSVFASMVAYDTEEMFAKTKRGKKRIKEEGKWQGGKWVRYGYEVDSNGYIVPNKDEADLINLIFREYATGQYSQLKLAKELTARGLSFRGNTIQVDVVCRILKDKAYIGEDPNVHYEGIVSKELFDQAQEVRNNPNNKKHQQGTTTGVHLGLRILKCAYCGRNYRFHKTDYLCHTRHIKGVYIGRESEVCDSPMIKANRVDKALWQVACVCHADMLAKMRVESLQNSQDALVIIQQKIGALNRKYDMINERNDRNMELYVSGDINKDVFNRNKSNINRDREEIESQLQNMKDEEMRIQALIDSIKEVNDDVDGYIKASVEIVKTTDMQKKYDLVHRYIKYATLQWATEEPEYKAIYILIDTIDGRRFKYKSIPYCKKGYSVYLWLDDKWVPADVLHTTSLALKLR